MCIESLVFLVISRDLALQSLKVISNVELEYTISRLHKRWRCATKHVGSQCCRGWFTTYIYNGPEARLMASAIVKENDNNMAQFYAESLIDYYVAEYYTPGKITNPNATEDPNDYEPSSI